MKISIVIVTYNGMQWLAKCLASIPKTYTVIAVDNKSTDGTCDFIKENHPEVQLFPQNKNLGFGRGNNLGIQIALSQDAEAVFLLNQDAYLNPDTIDLLVKAQQSHPEYGVLSPVHFNGFHTLLDRNFANYMQYDKCKDFYTDAYTGNLKELYEVPFVNAAAWFIPKSTLETIGGFDPIFSHYGEDDNYLQRVRYHNLKVGVVAQSTICHDREDRPTDTPEQYSNRYFILLERKWKIWYANPNDTKVDQKMDTLLSQLKSRSLRRLLQLDLRSYKGMQKEIALLHKTRTEVTQSRAINMNQGKQYL